MAGHQDFWEEPSSLNPHLSLREVWNSVARNNIATHLQDRRPGTLALTAADEWMRDAVETLRHGDPVLTEKEAVEKLLVMLVGTTGLEREMLLLNLQRLQRINDGAAPALAGRFGEDWEKAISRIARHLSQDTRTQKDAAMLARRWAEQALSDRIKFNPDLDQTRAAIMVADGYLGSKELDWTMNLHALLRLDVEKGQTRGNSAPRPPLPAVPPSIN